MILSQRISAFIILGKLLEDIVNNPHNHDDFYEIALRAENQNPWFTQENIKKSIHGIACILEEESILSWIESYTLPNRHSKRVAVIMAGNIPLVGFHDALCVLISGNYLIAKVSSKDTILMEYVLTRLQEIEPLFSKMYEICTEKLPKFDAIISTGSNNSARYFEYYFSKYPHIIRKNRNSVAVILQNDSKDIYEKIGNDFFEYFGLGCRNVSKLYVPENFDMVLFLDKLQHFEKLQEHHKYMNNYEYNRSIYLLSQVEHLDTGYAILKKEEALNTPLSVINYETYSSTSQLNTFLQTKADEIQCIVCSKNIFFKQNVLPGNTQLPGVRDYADDIDTLQFLIQL